MAERKDRIRCAVYTRKSSEEGLEQSFNSLDAQREACLAYVHSQKHEGWTALDQAYDDGGYSGGNMDRPALKTLLTDIAAGKVNVVVVYKVDRLSRSLADFAKMVEQFDKYGVSFVSVTQQFNTTTSMGRLTLNVLLSFAQFEREVTGERIRDKIAASKKKGIWMGGRVPFGYDVKDRKLVLNAEDAAMVNLIFKRYLVLGCVAKLQAEIAKKGITSRPRKTEAGKQFGGFTFSRGAIYRLLKNPIYIGTITHKEEHYAGEHPPIVSQDIWNRVQEKIKSNLQGHRTRTNAESPSLLAGLLFDENGHRMTPKHTKKGDKRYRYYVSQAVIQGRPEKAGTVSNISANTIECAVDTGLRKVLTDKTTLTRMTTESWETIKAKSDRFLNNWNGAICSEKIGHLKSLINKIRLDPSNLVIEFNTLGILRLLSTTNGTEASQHLLTINVPMPSITSQPPHRLVNSGTTLRSRPVSPTIKALANARFWFRELQAGNTTVNAQARRFEINERYVGTLLKLAFCSPHHISILLSEDQSIRRSVTAIDKYWHT